MKKVLVTGGAGFIGANLCQLLLENGHKVICLDNYSTGSYDNIAHLFKYKDFEAIEFDVEIPYFFDVDEIYNLACPASPIHYQSNPIKTLRTCVIGTINALELAARNHCKVLQASTSEIYGNPLIHPQTESYWGNVNPIGIRSCYDEGKRCAETLSLDYSRCRGVKVKVVRIFNTYGPKMGVNDGRVISSFITQALKGEDITVFGFGDQTRSFQYIDDLLAGMISMMESPDRIHGPINIGNPEEHSILELANIIKRKTRSKSRIVHRPLPSDDPNKRNPDITLSRRLLNWEPSVSLDEGLDKTIDYFNQQLFHNRYVPAL